MMRLAIIRQRYTPFGGAERFVESALEALIERNVAITLYTREWPETRLSLIEPRIIDPFYIGSLWRDWGFARAVSRDVGRAKLDLVQSHERLLACDVFRAGDGVHAVWLAERLRHARWWKRIAVRLNPWHWYLLSTERKLFASPLLQAVICNSAMVRDEIRQAFRVPDEKLRLIYNAIDTQTFSPALRESRGATRAKARIPEDAVVYLFVGSGFERKGVATAIGAIAQLPPAAHLVVVGRDKHLARYAALAKRLRVGHRVTLTGPLNDVKPFYGAADVFVLPTIYDPFPNAALEAMASGLPVITTTKSGAAELVAERDAGYVIASGDVASLAERMRSLLDAPTRERLGANARGAVLPLTPDAMTLQLVLLYKELLEASAVRQKHDAERKLRAHRDAWSAHVKPASPPGPSAPATPPAADGSPAQGERTSDGARSS
jgi:UDP-glucose:(heptosyl)LPS alpha-1,3-glucosyltransferase